ncbi:gluconate 2-dehydrogenase subunit 3 family protein [Heliorestis convoluta]|uniref:Gluconate 2-dehydrogenase subunit 3 family protein n=1 Tax=Heliorestis convoluta TaxID=356322 RepID=A0A5Q2MXW9_9FIRM|nr:gluconate 2-dehydrogenase subunit 3 family protein [Heliorestis convoluta]QGG47528.1 gluconate 2-dehydrogenase subunit 3 family protein [Heliorestis convoluta]
MKEQDRWDENTYHVIQSRLKAPGMPTFFSPQELALLKAALHRLLDEEDQAIIARVAGQIDEHLTEKRGQGYRKVGVPKEEVLFRSGLAWLDATALQRYEQSFLQLTPQEKDEILGQVQRGEIAWTEIGPKDFFNKLLNTAVDFFFSQPEIWSEIGYGGPAYPRGYYRIEYGLKDPWEARLKPELVEERAKAGMGPGPVRRVDR